MKTKSTIDIAEPGPSASTGRLRRLLYTDVLWASEAWKCQPKVQKKHGSYCKAHKKELHEINHTTP